MSEQSTSAVPSAAAPTTSRAYRAYVLGVLVAIYTSNFVDRTILGVLGQPIKEDLGLSDGQLGLLGGLSFALLYSTLGLPVARIAERRERVTVIAAALAVWSAMTALCGLAGNVWQLMAARIGVGIGEAGCSPPANSLIADYFPPDQRASAAGIYSLGIPLGALIGAIGGGLIAQTWGWRAAFFAVGLPGVALAVLARATIREPVRGGLDAAGTETTAPPLKEVARALAAKPAFVHLSLGAALASVAGYGISTFAVPFLQRGFDLSLLQASLAFGLFGAAAAAVGVGSGGFIVDRAGRKDKRLYLAIPALGFFLAAPLYMAAFLQKDVMTLGLIVVFPAVLQYIYMGPVFAVTANMASARSRATAAAILTLVINLIGLGLGPTLIGWASDQFAAHAFTLGDFAALCPGGKAAAGAAADAVEACRSASFTGLQRALVASAAVYLWAGAHLLYASRTLPQDLEA